MKTPELKTRQQITDWVNDELEIWEKKGGRCHRMIWQTKETRLRLLAAGVPFGAAHVRTPFNRQCKGYGNAHIMCYLPKKDKRRLIRRILMAGLGVVAYGHTDKTERFSDWSYYFVSDYDKRGKLTILKDYHTVRVLDCNELKKG